jgi:pyruvate,water dikinase
MRWIRWFHELTIADVPQVGGKNASLGEMIRELTAKGIRIPDGFAVTAQAYRGFLRFNELEERIGTILKELNPQDVNDLLHRTSEIRNLILAGDFPEDMRAEIMTAYWELSRQSGMATTDVAVRSSRPDHGLYGTAGAAGQVTS